MKKLLLFAITLVCSVGYSQITLTKHDLTPIVDGQVLAFNSIEYTAAELAFYVKNNAATSTKVKIRCEALVNNDGTGFELCFGNECLSSVLDGDSYPSVPVILAPNTTNGNFDHFLNTLGGSGPFPRDYVFRFYQINNSGVEISNSITLTYRYDPNLSVDEVNQLQSSGVLVKSTTIENQLELDVLKSTTMDIYDLNGKLVLNKSLEYGVQSVDVSNLASSVYVIQFTNEKGSVSTKKIIKK